MAVHAHNPSTALTDLRRRATQLSNIDSRTFLTPIAYGHPLLDDCQVSVPVPPAASAVQSQQQQLLFQAVTPPVSAQPMPSFTLFQQPVMDVAAHATVKKRRKQSDDRRSPQQKKQHAGLPLVDLNQAHTSPPIPNPAGVVSTGLRLAFDDERSTITSSRPEVGSAVLSTLREEVSAQLSQQREELYQLISSQADQLRQALEERRQTHSKAMLTSIEEAVSRRLREMELQLERVNRKNAELEDRVKHLNVESHMWQSKAKSNEAMVAVLRTNLQQAVVQSREQSKEGCGDSEGDDAASAHVDENAEAQVRAIKGGGREFTELVRACRRCRAKEACILLLPCRHLCLCNDCKAYVERCPLCHSLKSYSVEVYLS